MRNPVYCGKITVPQYKGEYNQIVKGLHQPLISESLFYKVQDVMDGRGQQQGTKFPHIPLPVADVNPKVYEAFCFGFLSWSGGSLVYRILSC
jgi:hypothetical protein